MQTARIIPFVRRNTFSEFERRQAVILSAFWTLMLAPLALWITLFTGEDE